MRPVWLCFLLLTTPFAHGADSVTVSFDPEHKGRPISPLIFGSNHDYQGSSDATIRRWGGNATETYNWENGFNNSGKDYQQDSGAWLTRYVADDKKSDPAAAVVHFHQQSIDRNVDSIVNVPVAGYVAADSSGPVAESEQAPSPRWSKVVPKKPGGNFSLQPDTTDGVVYVDEFVNYLVQKFGPADSPTGVKYYSLGNEPGLYHHTHPRIWKEHIPTDLYVQRAIETAKAIKAVDPTAKIVGPSLFGVFSYVGFANAPDWEGIKTEGGYKWFLDYYLDEFNKASKESGVRLLDVLTIHIYEEGEVIENGGFIGVMNSPRTLWDPDYREPSWISEILPEYLPVLPNVQNSINRYNPGTKLAFTEFDRQLQNQVYGGLAHLELLRAFIEHDVHIATAWPLTGFDGEQPAHYVVATRKLFLDYNGAGGQFGDTHLPSSFDNKEKSGVTVSRDSETGHIHVIVQNRNLHAELNVQINLDPNQYSAIEAFGFDEESADLKSHPLPAANQGKFTSTMKRRSATHYVFSRKSR